ncbi:MerR family transcriptional regulator [Peribacillus sp. NPDC097198]|uniref:MerR family transcriptional regulator n=1 Tax=Peribacillus sp. NPDC097198 TaxID=3364397 RepID=UPI0038211195
MKYIQEISRELGLKPYVLRRWEEYGWLGPDPVMKDPGNNNSRLYSDTQLERIYYINHKINEQKEKGIQRTDKQQMDRWLLDNFGGEVVEIEKQEIEFTQVLPGSMDSLIEVVVNQNKKLLDLESMVREQSKRPNPKDYTNDFEEMKQQLAFSQEREEKLIGLIEKLQEKVEESEENRKKPEKKGFWSRLFGD